jgi:hypothetical protein
VQESIALTALDSLRRLASFRTSITPAGPVVVALVSGADQ